MTDIKTANPGDYMHERFGRVPAVDVRDRRFAMPAPPTDRTYRNWLSPGPIFDQGPTPQCVAYAADRWLISHKVVNKLPWSHEGLYHLCQGEDEWEGEGYDGTSVRASFKVMKSAGFVQSYTWATEVEPIARHVLEIGPVVVGSDWTTGMFTPDAQGYLWPTGLVVGGHAWLISAFNRNRLNPDGTRGAFRMINSWGPRWGFLGKAWITNASLQALLNGLEDWPGEAATALELDIS